MKLSEYFEKTKGYGVLATADSKGKVDVAAYSKPFFEGEDTVGFAMYDRLTHTNLQGNPNAAYLFVERDKENEGKRLYLKKVKEESDSKKIDEFFKKFKIQEKFRPETKFIVYFKVEKALPLVEFK
jgi:hypothetical protein